MAEAGLVTHNEVNTTVAEIKAKEPSRITVVTPDNFDSYVNDKMGIDPEKAAKEEHAKLEAEKATKKAAETDVEAEEGAVLPKDKKGKLNERFSELTAKNKAAAERAEKAEAEAKEAREARIQAEEREAALKAKYEPVKTDPDPEPLPAQFTDVNEYAKALKEWTADNTRREDAKKAEEARTAQEKENTLKAWNERQAEVKKAIPDYEETIAKSSVKVSDQVRDAIIESEVGPQILHHLAKNPDEADRIGKLSVSKALREIGKLEVTLSGGTTKERVAEPKTTVAEISKAPAPITPLKGANAPLTSLSGTDPVPSNMDYEAWKKMRQAGKIR